MKWPVAGAVLGTAVAVTRVVARRNTGRDEREEPARWLAVTVNAEPGEVTGDLRLAEVFADFGDEVETRITAAPGGRGTEVAARPRQAPGGVTARVKGEDPRQDIRRALRALKSLLETGEVLQPDPPTTGKPTPGGALVRLATRRAGGEGRL